MGKIKSSSSSSSSSSSVKSQASINLFYPSLIVSSKVFQVHLTYNSAVFFGILLFILVTEVKMGAAAILEKLWSRFICTGVMPHYSPPRWCSNMWESSYNRWITLYVIHK